MAKLMDFIKVTPQYFIPKHMLSSGMHWFMQVETPWIKNNVIKLLTKIYGINISEAADEDINNYPHFNAFFTRALKPEARPIDDTPNCWVSPVDGLISQSTHIEGNKIIQAKCHPYTVEALVGGDISYAQQFSNGEAAVIYLSPKDYHRIHIPVDAKLLSMTYVPGDLFAVNPATVRQVDGLFARNERLVIRFENEQGSFCLIMVGAIFVGSMETVWEGKITPEYEPTIQHWDYQDDNIQFNKGDEIGRFNMGSTVVLLTTEEQLPELGKIHANTPIKMGELLAKYPNT
ncbi:MAG: archaetidylserine decarboxylase [Pseudomonadota bacterium]|nr:archaetidylserine decarboxylase [Pseudomonadota bacterium]